MLNNEYQSFLSDIDFYDCCHPEILLSSCLSRTGKTFRQEGAGGRIRIYPACSALSHPFLINPTHRFGQCRYGRRYIATAMLCFTCGPTTGRRLIEKLSGNDIPPYDEYERLVMSKILDHACFPVDSIIRNNRLVIWFHQMMRAGRFGPVLVVREHDLPMHQI